MHSLLSLAYFYIAESKIPSGAIICCYRTHKSAALFQIFFYFSGGRRLFYILIKLFSPLTLLSLQILDKLNGHYMQTSSDAFFNIICCFLTFSFFTLRYMVVLMCPHIHDIFIIVLVHNNFIT
jgi:hypothetical protein